MKPTRLIYLILFLTTFIARAAQSPKAVVEEIFRQAGNPQVANSKSIQGKIVAKVSFDTMAQNILRGFKGERKQRAWFTKTLKEIISLSVFPSSANFLKGTEISYAATSIDGNSAVIKSAVMQKGESTEVAYKLQKIKGQWKVVDVLLDEESWADSIREQVDITLQKSNWKDLRDKMQKKLDELKQKK